MKQTTLSVALEVQPQSVDRLRQLITDLREREDTRSPGGGETYVTLQMKAPSLHFISMSVFESADYDPLFAIEANFDGAPGPFWAELEAALEPVPPEVESCLRLMLRCCKRPADGDGPLYDAVTAAGARQPLTAYFEKRSRRPSVFHHGNRGLDRDRIIREGELFLATRVALKQPDPDKPNSFREMSAAGIHRGLREKLMPGFPWLAEPSPARITAAERAQDVALLFGFLFLALLALSVPGAVVAMSPASNWGFFVLFALAIVFAALIYLKRSPLEGQGAPMRSGGLVPSLKNKKTSLANPLTLGLVVALAIGIYLLVATTLGALLFAPFSKYTFAALWKPTFRVLGLGLVAAVFFSLPAILLWLRALERRDPCHDAPAVDRALVRGMAKREDRVAQNHMGSVVHVKPGVLRMALFRAGHCGLGLLLRVVATDGYLGSMRTVHFAHWSFVGNSGRLMFFSNFDQSWGSYLDDFIEKAHGGLTLAWGSGVGFPPTRFLVVDGASHGRKFKEWARHSMTVSLFWYSAYKQFTVDQIERNNRIAEGLRKPSLTDREAETWASDL